MSKTKKNLFQKVRKTKKNLFQKVRKTRKYLFQKVRKTRKLNKRSQVKIIKNVQGGNIRVLSKLVRNGKNQINLKIKDEPYKREVKKNTKIGFILALVV